MTPANSGLSLSGLAIRRHIGTLMLALAVIVMGLYFLTRLPVDLLPSIVYPRIGVRVELAGVTPEVAVEEITRPLEDSLSTVEGVEQLYSTTREGQVRVDLFFAPGGNIDQALNDTTAAVNRARGRLPDGVSAPTVFKFDPSQLPVYEFALSAPGLTSVELRRFAEAELARELGVVPGVATVDVAGGTLEEVQVDLDLERLQALGLGLADVLGQLQARNQDLAGGRIRGELLEPLTRTMGRFRSLEDIQALRFNTPSGGTVHLRDFATVAVRPAAEGVRVTLNGKPAVRLSIQKQPDANTIRVVDGIRRRLEQLRAAGLIPPEVTLIPTSDESRFIRSSIQSVALAGVSGGVLAGLAVLLFLGSLRQTLIVVAAIPLATLMAVLLMGLFGLSINIISLGGLALGVGIVVDNAIVMLEAIAKGTEGIPRQDARWFGQRVLEQAERSSRQLESALVASTATNLVSVLPFLLVGGFVSLIFNELILTISFAVAGSLVVSLTVVPMLASRLLTIRRSSGLGQWGPIRSFARAMLGGTYAYQRLLSRLLERPALPILLAFLLLGGGSYWMAGQLSQELLPRISTGQVNLSAHFAPGTTLDTNHRIMQEVDRLLLQQPEVEYVFTTAGGSAFGGSTFENPLRGTSTITLKPGTAVRPFVDRMNELVSQLNLVGSRIRLSPGSVRGLSARNSAINAEVDVVLQGEGTQALQEASRTVLRALDEQATLSTFRPAADDSQPELQIWPDWERAAPLRLSLQDIGQVVQTAVQGSVPAQLQQGDRLLDVRVRPATPITQPSQLERLPLVVQNGQPLRLGGVARLQMGEAPGEIRRLNQRQVVILNGSLRAGASQSAAIAEVDGILSGLELPPGVTRLPSMALENNRELRNNLLLLGSLAAFLVFVVMAVQYNSLLDPLVIMLTVPLALSGGILGLFLTRTAVGATVLVGAVLLVGIVVNNAILMVELANQIREEQGLDYRSAMLEAAPQRLRPILMTAVTTVLGLFPLALGWGEGSELLQPLGVVVFSGLSLATLLTLLVIPCFYVLLHGGESKTSTPSFPQLAVAPPPALSETSGQ